MLKPSKFIKWWHNQQHYSVRPAVSAGQARIDDRRERVQLAIKRLCAILCCTIDGNTNTTLSPTASACLICTGHMACCSITIN